MLVAANAIPTRKKPAAKEQEAGNEDSSEVEQKKALNPKTAPKKSALKKATKDAKKAKALEKAMDIESSRAQVLQLGACVCRRWLSLLAC
jgi:hypothetical protein